MEYYRSLFASIRKRPGMYLPRHDFFSVVAFVEGCDHGNAGSLLLGFREWLVTRAGCGDELAWWALVGHLTEPVGRKSVHDVAAEQDAQLVASLYRLLDDFLALRAEHDGLNRIYAAHRSWIEARRRDGCLASDKASCPVVDWPGPRRNRDGADPGAWKS